jgi:hypothetical protein
MKHEFDETHQLMNDEYLHSCDIAELLWMIRACTTILQSRLIERGNIGDT